MLISQLRFFGFAYWELFLTLVILVLMLIYSLRSMRILFGKLKNISKYSWLLLLVIIFFGFLVRLEFAPFNEYLGSPSWEYMLKAKYISQINHEFTYFSSRESGYPVLLSFSYLVFGISDQSTYWFNILFSLLGIAGIFVLTYLIFDKQILALIAALIFAIDKPLIFFSATGCPNMVFIFFTILSFVTLILAFNHQEINTTIICLFCLAFAVMIRFEFLPVSLFFAFFLIFFKLYKANLGFRNTLFLTVVFLILVSPSFFQISNRYKQINTEKNTNILNWQTAATNITPFVEYYFERLKELRVLLLPLVVGIIFFIVTNFRTYWKQIIFLSIWFCCQNSVYILAKLDLRYYSLACIPFLVLLACLVGGGIEKMSIALPKRIIPKHTLLKPASNILSIFFVILFFSNSFSDIIRSKMSVNSFKNEDRADEVLALLKKIDKNAYVIMAGNEAATMMLFIDNKHFMPYESLRVDNIISILNQNKSVYFITYRYYFDNNLNYESFYFPLITYNNGKILTDNFSLDLIKSTTTADMYRVGYKNTHNNYR